jgi:hypothetical protein
MDDLDKLLKEVKEPKREVQVYRPSYNPKDHYKNSGREGLWELPTNEYFIIEGINSGTYELNREHIIRFALKDVKVWKWQKDKRFSTIEGKNQSELVTEVPHINSIKRKAGLEYECLKEGVKTFWLGKREDYQSAAAPGVDRVSMKLLRDADILQMLVDIQKRMINYFGAECFITTEERQQRLNKTQQLVERVKSIREDENYLFIPWLTLDEIDLRIQSIQFSLDKAFAEC